MKVGFWPMLICRTCHDAHFPARGCDGNCSSACSHFEGLVSGTLSFWSCTVRKETAECPNSNLKSYMLCKNCIITSMTRLVRWCWTCLGLPLQFYSNPHKSGKTEHMKRIWSLLVPFFPTFLVLGRSESYLVLTTDPKRNTCLCWGCYNIIHHQVLCQWKVSAEPAEVMELVSTACHGCHGHGHDVRMANNMSKWL